MFNETSAELPSKLELDDKSARIVDLLSTQPSSFENLIAQSGMSIGELSELLLNLELAEIVVRQAGDVYVYLKPDDGQPSGNLTINGEEEASRIELFVGYLRSVFQLFAALVTLTWGIASLLTP
ncbi:MAG: hypothetical protein K2X81_12665, partial [Candidatus Obscuribacterales bacterium]|nr:hypothetical protein [Candidatus Obscuribacterales bacterium]